MRRVGLAGHVMTAGVLVAGVLAGGVLAGCMPRADGAPQVTFPPQSFGAGGAPTPAMQQARTALAAALGAAGLIVDEPLSPYRPAEAPRLAAAPRLVLRAVLPRDQEHGLISIYGFIDAAAAASAAQEQAEYVASPVGRVQFPTGTRFTIRQFGSAVVFYSEIPGESPDPQAAAIVPALETVGTEVPVGG